MRRKDKARHFLRKYGSRMSDDDVPEDLPRQAGAKEDNAPRVGVNADRGRGVGAEEGLPSAAGERSGVDVADEQHGLLREVFGTAVKERCETIRGDVEDDAVRVAVFGERIGKFRLVGAATHFNGRHGAIVEERSDGVGCSRTFLQGDGVQAA